MNSIDTKTWSRIGAVVIGLLLFVAPGAQQSITVQLAPLHFDLVGEWRVDTYAIRRQEIALLATPLELWPGSTIQARSTPISWSIVELPMSRQLVIGLVGLVLLALAGTVIARHVWQIESLQTRVSALESRIADIGQLKRLPAESGK